jgi:hypothetical protein
VIPRLHILNPIRDYAVDKPMLLCNAAAPATGQLVLERLRLADAIKWIGEDSGHQVKDTESDFAVRLDPEPQIVSKLA